MVPLSVKINGQRLDAEYRSADVQLRKLSDILDNVVANGCMDCWFAKKVHQVETRHPERPWLLGMHLNRILNWRSNKDQKPSPYRPICHLCYLPLREPYHPPVPSNQKIDRRKCPFQITDLTTNQTISLFPNLISYIFSWENNNVRCYTKHLSDVLGTKFDSISQLVTWLQKPVSSPAGIPNAATFFLTFYDEIYNLRGTELGSDQI